MRSSRATTTWRHASSYFGQGGGIEKLVQLASGEKSVVLLLPGAALLALAGRFRRDLVAPVCVVLHLFALPPRFYTLYPAVSLDFVAHFGWVALGVIFILRKRKEARQLFEAVWIPALVAGAITGYSSNNGSLAIGIGFFPAAVVSAIFLLWAVEDAAPFRVRRVHDGRWLAPVVIPSILLLMLVFEAVPVYRDGSLSTLTVRVANGPYAGLLTTPDNRIFLTG